MLERQVNKPRLTLEELGTAALVALVTLPPKGSFNSVSLFSKAAPLLLKLDNNNNHSNNNNNKAAKQQTNECTVKLIFHVHTQKSSMKFDRAMSYSIYIKTNSYHRRS